TGYIGDSQVANTDIILQAEDSDLLLGDSTSESVLTLSGGDVTATGALEAATLTESGNAVPNATDHLGFFGGTTSAQLYGEISDETGAAAGTPLAVFNTAPVFVTSIQLTGADADPAAAAGTIAYDNTITNILAGGALRWYDDNSVRVIVDLETDPTDDDYVVAYDSTADGFYMKADADSGGATAWDDISDPDAAATVDFTTFTQTIDIGVTDVGGPKSGLILDVTGLGAGTTDVIALEITTTTDDDTDYIPIAIYDDSGVANDLLFHINSAGQPVLRYGGLIAQDIDNYMKFQDNSDKIEFYFGGTDVDITWNDGVLNLRKGVEDGIDSIVEIEGKDAGEKGILRVLSDGDDKYIELYHDDTDAHIVSSSGDLIITPVGDDLLVDAGLTVGSSTEAGDNNLRVEGTSTLVGVIENASNIKSNP
ncbi:hypothetical protein LCGC14_2744450, partial [marine sediment metagenome]